MNPPHFPGYGLVTLGDAVAWAVFSADGVYRYLLFRAHGPPQALNGDGSPCHPLYQKDSLVPKRISDLQPRSAA